MPHMFVNRTRYHTGMVLLPSSAYHHHYHHNRHGRRRPLLRRLQRFSSWPPPGRKTGGSTRNKAYFQDLVNSTNAVNAEELLLLPVREEEEAKEKMYTTTLIVLLSEHFVWETFNTVAYELGGIIFILGSIGFLPAYHEYLELGVYLFIIGSLLYLIVAAHDALEVFEAAEEEEDDDDNDSMEEVINDNDGNMDDGNFAGHLTEDSGGDRKHFSRRTRYRLDLAASLIYVTGSLLFIIGSVVFLPAIEQDKFGALLFIIGSVLFATGSLINMVQIFESHDRTTSSLVTALLANLTAAFYLIGSTMFAVASVPYLFDFEATADANLIYTFLGWNYILGSVAFAVGGTINYVRASIILREQIAQYKARAKAEDEQEIQARHEQHKQQQYAYNHTWSAQPSTPMYLPEQSTQDDNNSNPLISDTDRTDRVMWQDLQPESTLSDKGDEYAADGAVEDTQGDSAGAVAQQLMEIFQETPTPSTMTTEESRNETTGLLPCQIPKGTTTSVESATTSTYASTFQQDPSNSVLTSVTSTTSLSDEVLRDDNDGSAPN